MSPGPRRPADRIVHLRPRPTAIKAIIARIDGSGMLAGNGPTRGAVLGEARLGSSTLSVTSTVGSGRELEGVEAESGPSAVGAIERALTVPMIETGSPGVLPPAPKLTSGSVVVPAGAACDGALGWPGESDAATAFAIAWPSCTELSATELDCGTVTPAAEGSGLPAGGTAALPGIGPVVPPPGGWGEAVEPGRAPVAAGAGIAFTPEAVELGGAAGETAGAGAAAGDAPRWG